MIDDEMDLDRDDIVDLDGCDVTGDPALDQFGYNSPSRRGQNLTGFTSSGGDYLAASREGRARRQAKRAAWRQRLAQRQQPDRPASHVEQAVEQGAPGRAAGWWRVDIAPDGSSQWSKVDTPGDGRPWITAHTPAPQPPAPQWQQPAPARRRWWQRGRPAEPQPSPGTRIW
ncbi:MAG: hypothetical protein ACLPYO_03860 [Mycobacterium sp.]